MKKNKSGAVGAQSLMPFLTDAKMTSQSRCDKEYSKVISFEAFRASNAVKTYSPKIYSDILGRIEHLREM